MRPAAVKLPMRYLRVTWLHPEEYPLDPIELWYELGEDNWATRGVEVFADCRVERVTAGLSAAPIPTLEELRDIAEFGGEEVNRAEFESVWERLPESAR